MRGARPTIRDFTGGTVIRFETVDGLRYNIDDEEAARRVQHGGLAFRGMPGHITGDMVEPWLYGVLRLDPHRFVFDLPSSMKGTGSTRTGAGRTSGAGTREGFVFQRGRDGKAEGRPVGKVIFMTTDRKFDERDPECREDFERM